MWEKLQSSDDHSFAEILEKHRARATNFVFNSKALKKSKGNKRAKRKANR